MNLQFIQNIAHIDLFVIEYITYRFFEMEIIFRIWPQLGGHNVLLNSFQQMFVGLLSDWKCSKSIMLLYARVKIFYKSSNFIYFIEFIIIIEE